MSTKEAPTKRGVYRTLLSSVVICAFLAFVNYRTTPHCLWIWWVVAGLGLVCLLEIINYLFLNDKKE